jgi:inner membrane protein
MSSLFGHALVGAALYFAKPRPIVSATLLMGGVVVGLAVLPDCDYLVFWLLGFEIEPRLTHSLGFCLGVGFAAGLLLRIAGVKPPLRPSGLVLLAAPLSHLALDLLVGVHPMPLFWPVSDLPIRLPFGLLPSAGKLSLSNGLLWRNLAIEIGILTPLAGFYGVSRRRAWRRASPNWGLF